MSYNWKATTDVRNLTSLPENSPLLPSSPLPYIILSWALLWQITLHCSLMIVLQFIPIILVASLFSGVMFTTSLNLARDEKTKSSGLQLILYISISDIQYIWVIRDFVKLYISVKFFHDH